MQVALEGSRPSSPSGTRCTQMGGLSLSKPSKGGLEHDVTNLRNWPCSSGVNDWIASQNHWCEKYRHREAGSTYRCYDPAAKIGTTVVVLSPGNPPSRVLGSHPAVV